LVEVVMNRLTVGSLVLLALGVVDLVVLDAYFAPRAFAPSSGTGTVDPLPGQPPLVAKNVPKPPPAEPIPPKPAPEPEPAPAPAPEPEPAPAPEPEPEPAPEPAPEPEPAKPEPEPEPAKPEPKPEPPKPEPKPEPPPKPKPVSRPPAPTKAAPIRLFFATNRSRLSPKAKASLIRLANVFKQYPGSRIRLDGHADRRGEQKYNMELGRARAGRAAVFLEALGVKPLSMIKRSFGSTVPLDTADTPSGWARNRRADIYLDTRGQK